MLSALAVLGWGFERYRSNFKKGDLALALALAGGFLTAAFVPELFGRIGTILDINNRPFVMAFLAILVLVGVVLYLLSRLRQLRDDLTDLTRNLVIDQAPVADGGQKEISIVIPAYNEADTIKSVVTSLPDEVRGYAVQPIVISDGSADDTAERAQYNGTIVVEHPLNQGQGGALKTGFELALRDNATIVVTMDGDGQHPVDELERLVSPIIDDEADYVMGSRYKGRDLTTNGYTRQTGIRAFTWLINCLTKSEITDCTNGYRAIRGSKLTNLELTEERFSAPELIIEARKNGLRIQEIPITVAERQAGESKKPKLGYALGLVRTILATWIR